MVPAVLGRSLLLAWDVSADQEEPWRRFLQELSNPHYEGYVASRRDLGISAESVWLAPKPSGGGVAVVWLEAEDPERALRELAATGGSSDRWYVTQMRRLFGSDFSRSPRVAKGILLFAWRESAGDCQQKSSGGS